VIISGQTGGEGGGSVLSWNSKRQELALGL